MQVFVFILFIQFFVIKNVIAFQADDKILEQKRKSIIETAQFQYGKNQFSDSSDNVNSERMMWAATIVLMGIKDSNQMERNLFKEAVDFVVNKYNENPKFMSILGLGIGIVSIADSLNDMTYTYRLSEQIYDAFEACLQKEITHNYLKKRLTEIRQEAEDLRDRQRLTGALKLIPAFMFGFLAWTSTAGILAKTTIGLTSGFCGAASIINGVNYYNLHKLIERLKQDKYLD